MVLNFYEELKGKRLEKHPNISKSELFKVFDHVEKVFDSYSIYKSGFGQMVGGMYRDQLAQYGASLLKAGCYEVYNLAQDQTCIPTEDAEIKSLVEECLHLDNIMLSFYWSSFDDYEMYDALVSMMVDSVGCLMPPILAEFARKHLKGEIKRPVKSKKTKLHYTRDRLICYLILSLDEYLEINPTAGADKIHTVETGCSLVAEWIGSRSEQKRAPRGYKGVENIWTKRDVRNSGDSNGDNFVFDRIRRMLLQLKDLGRMKAVPTN